MISNLKRYTLYIVNLTDIVAMLVSYAIAFVIRSNLPQLAFIRWGANDYSRFLMIVIIGYIIFNILSLYNDDNFLKRNTREEFAASLKMVFYVMTAVIVYLYAFKVSQMYSRLFIGIYAGLLLVIDFALRTIVKKKVIPMFRNSGKSEKVMILASRRQAEHVIEKILDTEDWRFIIKGLVITDEDLQDEMIGEYPVLSTRENMFRDIEQLDIDSVLIVQDQEGDDQIESWLKEFRRLGKIIHVQIDEFDVEDSYRGLDRIGNCPVVSYHNIAPMPKRQALIRRIFSLAVAVVLFPVYVVVYLLAWLFTLPESAGKMIVTRVRLGRNNRRFYQYRFRYYRLDAQQRIDEGKSPYTVCGRVLRFTHLDGLPVILNILAGDMDLIGPKAPSLPRYLKMSSSERNKLSIRPGAIGYWSCEKNKSKNSFDEDDYVLNWNIGKDFFIIVITLMRYVTFQSIRKNSDTHEQEELAFAAEQLKLRQPLEYDRTYYTKKQSVIYLFIKRLFDIVLSLIAIILLSPVLLILTVLVTLDDGGSPFYGHTRVGKNGKYVTIYKFRSMRQDAGDLEKLLTPEQLEQYQKEFKIDNDPRITKVGNFIRRTSLDELPQLFNILFGSLSIVGPRPIVEEETKIYGREIGKLLSVKPGLTGYWQAYARNNATYETGERQRMEMYYVDHASLWLDFRIILRTFVSVLKKEGAQ